MRDARPGDQAVVPSGAYLRAIIGNEESWCERPTLAVIVGTSHRIVEDDDEVSGTVVIFIADRGLFLVEELSLMTVDEYQDPSRLFPPTRLREP